MKRKAFAELLQTAKEFVHERQWEKFHTPKNLAMSMTMESAEVMEHFIWATNEQLLNDKKNLQEIEDEMGDVLFNLLCLASALNVDIESSFYRKMEKLRTKYPKDKFQGKSRYDLQAEQK